MSRDCRPNIEAPDIVGTPAQGLASEVYTREGQKSYA